MSQEMPEKPGASLQLSERQASILAGIAIAASLLMLILIVAMIGFLFYGAIAASGIALMGSLFCLAGSFVLFGLFTLIAKVTGMEKAQREASPTSDAKVQEEQNKRSSQAQTTERQSDRLDTLNDSAKERFSDALATGRETYARLKAELNARYNRAKHGEY